MRTKTIEPYTDLAEAWDDIETLRFSISKLQGALVQKKEALTKLEYTKGQQRTLTQLLSYIKEDADLILIKLDLYLND